MNFMMGRRRKEKRRADPSPTDRVRVIRLKSRVTGAPPFPRIWKRTFKKKIILSAASLQKDAAAARRGDGTYGFLLTKPN